MKDGWTWHFAKAHKDEPREDGVHFCSGGRDDQNRPLDEATARELAAAKIQELEGCPGWTAEAYVKDPERVAYPEAEQGDVWWPRLGA